MKPNMKPTFFIFVAVIALILMFSGCQQKPAEIEIPTNYMGASFVIDVDNINERVGDADYVFIGNVVSNDGAIYEPGNPVPRTKYTVQVLENIKGELSRANPLPVQKEGGLEQDKKAYSLYEDDMLPIVGDIYVFYIYAQSDGETLLISGPHSNVKVNITISKSMPDEKVREMLRATAAYQEVVEALENQVITERERFTNIYDTHEG